MSDLPERLLCIDKTCTGTINDRGYCNVCGKSLDEKHDLLNSKRECGDMEREWTDAVPVGLRTPSHGEAHPGRKLHIKSGCGVCGITWVLGIISETAITPGQTSKTSMYITGTIEGAGIEFWIYEAGQTYIYLMGARSFGNRQDFH